MYTPYSVEMSSILESKFENAVHLHSPGNRLVLKEMYQILKSRPGFAMLSSKLMRRVVPELCSRTIQLVVLLLEIESTGCEHDGISLPRSNVRYLE